MPPRKRCWCAPSKGFGKRASYLAQVSQSPCKRVITASNFGKYKRIHAPRIEVRGLFIRIGLRHARARRLKVSKQCGVANPSQVLVNQPFKRVGNTFAGIRLLDAPQFMLAQVGGAFLGLTLFELLKPKSEPV